MVLRSVFPAQGGGWARRYYEFRKTMFRIGWSTSDSAVACPPIALFDFSRPHDAVDATTAREQAHDGWRVSDDRVIGGYSTCAADLVDSSTPPFVRWHGTIDTTLGLQSSAQRSGFAALRSPEFPFDGANLQGLYNALEVTCRPDHRTYTLQLQVSSSIPDDVYKCHIQSRLVSHEADNEADVVQPSEQPKERPFETFYLPFGAFTLTSMGREREVFRELDDKVCVESIGVSLLDGHDGEFQFDLARIRAVNVRERHGFLEFIQAPSSAQ